MTRIFIRDSESSHSSSLPPSSSSCIRGDPPKKQNLLIKDCVFIVTCLNFSHLPSTPFDAVHLSRCFFHCSKQFLNLLILMPLVLLLFFLFHFLYICKMFSLEEFFHRGKEIKSCSGQYWVNREGGAWGSCHFWSKTAEHSVWCRQVCS